MLFWMVCSLFLGGLIGGYSRLRYTGKALLLSWKQLLICAAKKRCVLHEIVELYARSLPKIEEEKAFLLRGTEYSLKEFLKAYDEDSLIFYEMERVFTLRLKQSLELLLTSPHEEKLCSLMEELLAYENAFAFEARAFDEATEKYVSLHKHPVISFAGKLFRFPKISRLSLAEVI